MEKKGLVPRRRFGQHFLERAWAEKVIRAISPAPADVFIEIGAGRGALTRPLAEAAAHVIAIEIDRDLVEQLGDARMANVTIVAADALRVTADQLQLAVGQHLRSESRLRVAGNLPYNVASPILLKLIDLHRSGLAFCDSTLMVQREVAERLLAAPGSRDYGALTVAVRHSADVRLLLSLPPGAFRPAPRVHSSVLRLAFHAPSPVPRDPDLFAALTRSVFTRRRKMLVNALAAFPARSGLTPQQALAQAALDGHRRPETLTVDELVRLADIYAKES